MQRLPLLASLLTLCLLGALSSRAADSPAPATVRPALTVAIAQPSQSHLSERLLANGNVAAWQEASIGTQTNGLRLADVRVNVGDVVRAGQVLATFADDTVRADIAQARAALSEAQANAAEAAANGERAQALSSSGAMAAQQVTQYTTAAQAAQARVASAQAAVQAQQLRLTHTQVVAPDSGVISARSATVGAVLGTGTELFRMVRKGRLEWRAEVASSELPRVRAGQRVEVTAASGAQVQGTVRALAPTVDPQTRNALVYVDLPAHADIRAGMFARGDFQVGQRTGLTVPLSAVIVRDGFSHVFVMADATHVRMARVQTGQRNGDTIEVRSGLKAQDAIVVRGGAFLSDGDVVRVPAALEQKQAPSPVPSAQTATKNGA